MWLKKKQAHKGVLILGLALCLFSCGYHFAGKGEGLPSDIKTIAIPFFTNKSFEPGIENFFTNALIDEFLKRGRVDIGKTKDSEATITGVITSFKTSPISFNGNNRALEYRATVTLEVSLKRNDNGTVIWESSKISRYHEYSVSSDTTMTYENKRQAIKKIAEDLAEEIHNRIFEGF
ncbi:MAG: LptE family protein [Thermodesulfobacteriota bacterium]|nr:LptE family protein [Thermodesulfobacteriota bacterium]